MQFIKFYFTLFFLLISNLTYSQWSDSSYFSPNKDIIKKSYSLRKADAQKAYLKGNTAYDAGYYQASLSRYDEALRDDPYFAEAYFARALTKEQLGDLTGALVDYEIVIKLNPESIDPYFNRGLLRFKLKQFEKAIEDFSAILRLTPKNTTTVYFEGTSEGPDDVPTLTGISTLQQNWSEVYNNLGLCYAELNRFKEALYNISEAINLNASKSSYLLNRGTVNYKAGLKEDALRDFEAALELDPENKFAFYKIAQYKRGLENDSLQLEFYNRAIAQKKTTPTAYLSRAVIKFKNGDFDAALLDYDEAISIDDQNPEAFLNRGLVKEKLKKFEAALEDYDKAIKLRPGNPKGYTFRGNANFKLNRFSLAAEDFSKSIQIKDSDGSVFYNRGLARYLSKQRELGCADWKRALLMGYKPAEEKIKEFCMEGN